MKQVRDDYIVATEAAGFAADFQPKMTIDNTPAYVYYDSREKRVVVPFWPDQEDRALMEQFVANLDDGTTEEVFFTEMFNWFLVAHELGHFTQDAGAMDEQDRYTSELHANEIAVHFWIEQGETERLETLVNQVTAITDALGSPLPADVDDPIAYFNENYGALTQDATVYGWYQFEMLEKAYAERDDKSFAGLMPQ